MQQLANGTMLLYRSVSEPHYYRQVWRVAGRSTVTYLYQDKTYVTRRQLMDAIRKESNKYNTKGYESETDRETDDHTDRQDCTGVADENKKP